MSLLLNAANEPQYFLFSKIPLLSGLPGKNRDYRLKIWSPLNFAACQLMQGVKNVWDFYVLEVKLLKLYEQFTLCIALFSFVDGFIILGLGIGYLNV